MLVPLEWLAEYVDLPQNLDAHELAAELAGIGLEEEDYIGPAVTGPLVVGRVLTCEPEKHSNGKTINWCTVDVGADEPQGIVCGAHNFGVGDYVVAALPGAVLPGDFAIAARKTYGHISDGMICSARELGLGEDHDGIIVLTDWGFADLTPGQDATELLGLNHEVLDVNITPDRGYQMSMRGIGREYALLKEQNYADPADAVAPVVAGEGHPVELTDDAPIHGNDGCTRFTALRVRGIDPTAQTPFWMSKRLLEAGMRPISLVVDITNYVMLELGQPLHAYDLAHVGDKIVVRRGRKGDKLTTLDDAERSIHPEDVLVTGVSADGTEQLLGLAGVMGGADSEVSDTTVDVLIEGAHWDPVSIARTARRHRLPSEAAKRFERGVDPALGPAAVARTAQLLTQLAGGQADATATIAGSLPAPREVILPKTRPAKVVGIDYTDDQMTGALRAIGCEVEDSGDDYRVTVPSWRPDLTDAEDLIEEIARVNGYDQIPSIVPQAPGGEGLTRRQASRRTVSNLLADLGLTEVLTYPFTSEARHDAFRIPEDDPRRNNLRLANPLSDDQPLLRTELLPTLVDAQLRNQGRGFKDTALFEIGLVTQPETAQLPASETFAPGYHPTEEERAAIFDAVPHQPLHAAGIVSGNWELEGVWGKGRKAEAMDAIEIVKRIAVALGQSVTPAASDRAPFHPGRCAEFRLADGTLFGHAGELHPKVVETLGLPARTVAFEVVLDSVLDAPAERRWAGALSTYPVSRQDVALIVDDSIAIGDLVSTMREAIGGDLEELELFDEYRGEQVGEGKKSLAFRMTFRAADRTMTSDEASALREAATAAVEKAYGAVARTGDGA